MSRVKDVFRHGVIPIEVALQACEQENRLILFIFDQPSFDQFKATLLAMKEDGLKVVPRENCNNYDFDGRCLGHVTWKKKETE